MSSLDSAPHPHFTSGQNWPFNKILTLIREAYPTLPCTLSAIIWGVLILWTNVVLVAIAVTPFKLSFTSALPSIISIVGALIGLSLRQRNWLKTGTAVEQNFLCMFACMLTLVSANMLGSLAFPYQDQALLAADKALFNFEWRGLTAFVVQQPHILATCEFCYKILFQQPVIVIPFLVCAVSMQAAREFTLAWTLTLLAVVCIYPFFPAAGAFVTFDIQPGDLPIFRIATAWNELRIMEGVRNMTLLTFEPNDLAGIISFPSFHAAGAAVFAWSFSRIPVLKWIGIPLNIIIIFAAIPIGAHYLVDVVAGIAVACLAIIATKAVARLDIRNAVRPGLLAQPKPAVG